MKDLTIGLLLSIIVGLVVFMILPQEPKNELDVIHENHRYNIQLPEEFMFATEDDSLRAYTRNDTLFVHYD